MLNRKRYKIEVIEMDKYKTEYDTGDFEKLSMAYLHKDRLLEIELSLGLYGKSDVEDLIKVLSEALEDVKEDIVESDPHPFPN
jgi:hypothetical protein